MTSQEKARYHENIACLFLMAAREQLQKGERREAERAMYKAERERTLARESAYDLQ